MDEDEQWERGGSSRQLIGLWVPTKEDSEGGVGKSRSSKRSQLGVFLQESGVVHLGVCIAIGSATVNKRGLGSLLSISGLLAPGSAS